VWRSKQLRIVLGLAISAVLLLLVLRKVDFDKVLDVATGVSIPLLAASIALKLIAVVIKAARWGLTLRAMLGEKPSHHMSATFLGFFGNSVFPAKLGEIVRIEVVRRNNDTTFAATLATLLLERTLDALMLLLLLGLAIATFPLPDWISSGALPVAGMTAVLVLFIILFASRRLRLPAWMFPGKAGAWAREKSEDIIERFGVGLTAARSPRVLVMCSGLTAAAWALECTGTWIAFRAFGLELPVAAALALTSIVSVGLALPSAPSGMGTHQFLCVTVLEPFAVSADAALGFSLVTVFAMLLALSAIGLALTWREGISLSDYRDKVSHAEDPVRGPEGPVRDDQT
jgi:uncharacterized protein (TIRG00374 family)